MTTLYSPSYPSQFFSFPVLGAGLKKILCEENSPELGEKLKENLYEKNSSELGEKLKESLGGKNSLIISCEVSEFFEKENYSKNQTEYFVVPLPADLNEQEAEACDPEIIYLAEPVSVPAIVISDEQGVRQQYCSSTGTVMPISDWLQPLDPDAAIFSPKAQQASVAVDMEKGKEGERWNRKRKDSAISLSFLSDKQGAEQQYCAETETSMLTASWPQSSDLDAVIFNPKAEQASVAVDMEKGKEGARRKRERKDSAIPLRFLSDKQVVKQQYCAKTGNLINKGLQDFDSDAARFSPKAQQASATLDMEKGKKGGRFEQKREDSAISLRFLSDKQVVERQYCAKTGNLINKGLQDFDLDGAIFNSEFQKAQQALANFEEAFKLLV